MQLWRLLRYRLQCAFPAVFLARGKLQSRLPVSAACFQKQIAISGFNAHAYWNGVYERAFSTLPYLGNGVVPCGTTGCYPCMSEKSGYVHLVFEQQ